MSFSQFPVEITKNIFSFMDHKTFDLSYSFNIIRLLYKYPKFARKKFIESLHPFYLFCWIVIDHKKNYKKQVIQIALEKNMNSDLIIYLIKIGFSTNFLNHMPIFQNCNFDLIKYYHFNFGKILCSLNNIIKNSRIDILEWLFDNKYMSDFNVQRHSMEIAVRCNNVDILEYLKKKNCILLANDYTFYEVFEFDLMKNKINLETLKWCWSNDYKWTKKQAEYIESKDMISFFI